MVTYQEWIHVISDLPIPLYELKEGEWKRVSPELERAYFESFKKIIRESQ